MNYESLVKDTKYRIKQALETDTPGVVQKHVNISCRIDSAVSIINKSIGIPAQTMFNIGLNFLFENDEAMNAIFEIATNNSTARAKKILKNAGFSPKKIILAAKKL